MGHSSEREHTSIPLDCKSEFPPQLTERVDAPHVVLQAGDIAKIQDQVPDMMSTDDSGESSVSPIENIKAQDRVQSIHGANTGILSKHVDWNRGKLEFTYTNKAMKHLSAFGSFLRQGLELQYL